MNQTRSGRKSRSKLTEEEVSQTTTPKLSKKKLKIQESHNIDALQKMAHQLRIHSIEMTNASGSGHPTSCSSMAELTAVLFFDASGMHYDAKNPKESFVSDRFVLSKGHAAPILFAAWAENGFIEKKELLNLRKFDCNLEGHPTPILPFVDVATGSLGQGLGCASGMAYSSKYLDKLDNRIWTLLGDGECAEGSVWEAANFAGIYKLDNLTAIVDVNRLGQSEATSLQHDVNSYKKRFESFGWNSIVVDGHDLYDIIEAFTAARNKKNQPTAIIAQTFKGKYLPEIEDQLDWHGKPLGNKAEQAIKHLKTLIQGEQQQKENDMKEENKEEQKQQLEPTKPSIEGEWKLHNDPISLGNPEYKLGDNIATRKAYGNALQRLGKNDTYKRIVGLDGDTKNSTFSITFKNSFPENFVECYIAEQNMVSVATGLGCRNKIPFASTFGAFFSRGYDQIRMAAISKANIKLCGSHSGVSIGEDGASQMALEDLAMFRAIPNATVLYPSDAVSCERAVELAANTHGIFYIRSSRPETPVIYSNEEKFQIGQCKVVAHSESDKILIVAAGITLSESLKAQKKLAAENIHVRVIDIFSIKPIDQKGLIENAKKCHSNILTIEDHYGQGGIYEAVCGAVINEGIKVHGVYVTNVPRSGKPQELLDHYQLSESKIIEKVKTLI